MAGPASSSSSFGYQWPYDVFLNFRGEDTRNSFVGNLFNALRQKGIQIFMDDGELKKGDKITPSLFKAIEESRMAITVFSKNYASSTFCLDELVKILQCIKGNGRLVLPIFYDVEPSYVRHQKGNYEEALAMHQKNFKANEETIQNWKLALREAANLSGLHFNPGYEYEYQFIEKIVNEISSKINRTLLNIAKYPIGLESRVSKINSRLQVESCDQVIMVGICGIGGIGKSTITRAIFNSIADQFEGLCFLDDIKENSSKLGLEQLQERILSNILGVNIKVECVNKGIPIIKRRLNQKKILLILDNVDKEEQLENLAGNCDWFGSGSRIIITTRNKHLLARHGVERLYEVEALNNKESLDLLGWNAFKMNQVDPSYMKVLTCVVNYAKGLPLALQVIGSHLFGKSIEEWKSAIDIYKRIPNEEVHKILKVSYDGLGEAEKEIFLDIASFFKGHDMIYVKEMVQYAHGFNPNYGIRVLMDKCLIDIENDLVKMHDLIQYMGREIVRQESSIDPGKRSRLWNHEDIIQVLENNTGTDKINCIIQDNFFEDIKVNWDGKAFKKIKNLKILIFKKASFSQGPKHLPNYLRVLQWPKYPSSWLPVDFHPKKLAILNLRDCCFLSLEPIKKFENLNVLSFANSQFITHIPDLSCAPNLKELVVDNCENLIEIHDGYMGKLEELWARGCVMLRTFPHSINLPSLTFLELSKCITGKKISKIFKEMEHVTQLDLSKMNFEFSCSIRELAVDYFRMIALLPKVESTFICKELRADKVTEELSSMQHFKISQVEANISNELLSMYLGWFGHVETLQLSFSNFTVLPACINECHRLMTLVLNDCKHLSEIKGIPPNICRLEVDNCLSLSSKSKSILLSKELHEWGDKEFLVPGASIPKWFNHCSRGPSISFWFRNNFPIISLCFVVKLLLMDKKLVSKFLLVDVIINGKEIFHAIKVWEFYGWNGSLEDHILCACVLNCSIFNNSELNEVMVKTEWNHVEVRTYMTVYDELDGKEIEAERIRVKEIGMNVMKLGNRMVDIQFINPFKSIFKGSSNPLLIWDYEKLWKLQLPEKIKIFLWKAIHNELAIKDNLTIRGTNMYDYTCPNCGAVAESIMHTLVACPFAEVIWSMPPLMLRSQSLSQASFSSWWEGLSRSLSYCQDSVGMLEIAGFICWRIWKCRNAKVFNGGSREARQVILLVMQQVNEFQASLQGMRDWLIALPKIDEEEVMSRVRSNAEDITLKECNISDELLQICRIRFANVKYLDLSGNNFTFLPAHIKECRFLEELILDDCKYLREIRGIPSNIYMLSAINCTSLSSESTNLVLSQELLEEGDKEFWVPGARIPKLFEHCSQGPSIYFWFRNKFPAIYFCFIIPEDKSVCTKYLGAKVIINGKEIFNDHVWNHKLLADHIFVYSLRMRDFPDNEMDHLFHKNMWNHVEVCIHSKGYNGEYEIGMNVIKAESRMEDIQFTNPYKDLQQPQDLNRRSLTWDPMEWECPVDRLEDELDLNDQAGTICDKDSLNPLLIWDYEKLWKLQLPEKIKIFLWKALHNELAIKDNLTIGGTNMYDHTCPNCGAVAESIMHTLVACPFAEVIWSMPPLMMRSQNLPQASFSSWWEGLSSSISYLQDSVGMLKIAGFICWRIWKCRNAKVFNGGSREATLLLVMQQVNEFQASLQGMREYNNDRQWFSLQASLDKSRASFLNSLECNSHTITHQESRKDDDDYDLEDEEEQSLTSTNSQISESCEVVIEDKGKGMAYRNNPEEEQSGDTWDSMILECLRGETSDEDAKTSKIFLGSTAEAEHEPMFQKGGKLKEDVNLVPGSTSPVSTSTNKGGQQKNGPSNIKISEKDALIKRKAEATVHFKQNLVEKSHTLPESRANQQSAAKEIEDGLTSKEAFITEDNMDAFYASLETETTALSDTQINTEFVNTRPSEETQKALQILRDFVHKKFSLLLQPRETKLIKYILEYLLSLSPEDGISLKTKSVILQLSRSFTRWSLDYNDASHKLESAGADLAKVDELKEGLEANVREFREVEKFENEMWSKLADLEEEKRKLEEQINAIKAQIADYTSSKDTAAQRKRMVFDHGRRLKAQRDDLRNRAPRLRAEQESAKINQANIEDEWLKLGEQFIASSSFEDWT